MEEIKSFWANLNENDLVALDVINHGLSIKAWLTIKTGDNMTSQYYLGKSKPCISFPFPGLSYKTAIFLVGIVMKSDKIKVMIAKGNGKHHQFDRDIIWRSKQTFDYENIPNVFHFNIDTTLLD